MGPSQPTITSTRSSQKCKDCSSTRFALWNRTKRETYVFLTQSELMGKIEAINELVREKVLAIKTMMCTLVDEAFV